MDRAAGSHHREILWLHADLPRNPRLNLSLKASVKFCPHVIDGVLFLHALSMAQLFSRVKLDKRYPSVYSAISFTEETCSRL